MANKVNDIFKRDVITEVIRVKQVVLERAVEYSSSIGSTGDAGRIGVREIRDEAQEVVLVLILDTKNKINAMHRAFQGSLNSSIAHPREIFRSALLNNGARILRFSQPFQWRHRTIGS